MPYTGRDGLTHQETILDWDKTLNTKISTTVITQPDGRKIRQQVVKYRLSLISRILSVPSALAGERYLDFVNRDFDTKTITWNEPMIKNEGLSLDNLRDMAVILEKRLDEYNNNSLSLKTPQIK